MKMNENERSSREGCFGQVLSRTHLTPVVYLTIDVVRRLFLIVEASVSRRGIRRLVISWTDELTSGLCADTYIRPLR